MDVSNNLESDEIERTWNKFSQSARKAGYREGAAKAKDEIFQGSFDNGYNEGFKNGFMLGKYKGASRMECITNNVVLEETRKAFCQICKNEKLVEVPLDNTRQFQNKKTKELFQNLYFEFSHFVHKYDLHSEI